MKCCMRERQLVSEETELAIRNAIKHSSERNAGAIRAALGNTFSYPEIRAVLLQMEHEENGTIPAD